MSNAVYDPGREGFLNGTIRWDGTAVIKAVLVKSYTYSAAHKWVSDVTGSGATLVGTPIALASQTATNGVANAATATLVAVPAGAACQQILIYQASAVTGGADVAAGAQRVIACIDTSTGLPITPNGADIPITWDTGANKIFKL